MQHPEYRVLDSMRKQRTQPALPGVTLPTMPIVAQPPHTTMTSRPARRTQRGGSKVVILWGLALLLEGVYLALYPLLIGGAQANDPFRQAIESAFPWVSMFYWTTRWPLLAQPFNHVPWLDPRSGGALNLSFLFLSIACVVAFLAARVARRRVRQQLSNVGERGIFWTIFLATALLGMTLMYIPVEKSTLPQDMALYGLYGRMVVAYHVNPYVVAPSAFPSDILQALVVSPKTLGTAPYGPLWLDVSVLVAFLTQDSIAHLLLDFRLIGLVVHLANTALIWTLLTRLKPESRASATLLYAWNPVVLLLGVGMMHQEGVVVLLGLLAFLFLQRNSWTLAWVCMLLAALANPFFLLLLPLFLRIMLKEARVVHIGRCFLWCLGIGCISVLVVGLTYFPYWEGWGQQGLLAYLRQTFLPDTAMNSLDAALRSMPISLPPVIQPFISPAHWAMFALALVGCILLFALWFADTLELALLFSSWVLVLMVVLMPTYWPWYVIPPLALAICSTSRTAKILTVLLMLGALLSSFFLLGLAPWSGQALLAVGLPFLLCCWLLFFTSTWRMTRRQEAEEPERQVRRTPSFSRSPSLSRPSGPSRSEGVQRNR
jgi:hypothetical protein